MKTEGKRQIVISNNDLTKISESVKYEQMSEKEREMFQKGLVNGLGLALEKMWNLKKSNNNLMKKCKRCDYEWVSRISNGHDPVMCPKCTSTYWNKERIRVKK